MSKKETNQPVEPKEQKPAHVSEEVVVGTNVIELKEEEKEQPALKEVKPAPASVPPPIRKELDVTLPAEERIMAFIENVGKGGPIKINDFLKSLFPVPKGNETPMYLQQQVSKQLKILLQSMVLSGKISIAGDAHMRLGQHYYPDATTMKTHYYNILTLDMVASKK